MNINEIVFFGGFLVFIAFMLAIDLGIFTRKVHKISFNEAVFWSVLWISISLVFYFFLIWFGDKVHGVHTLEDVNERIQRFGHAINIEGFSESDALTLYKKNLALEYLSGYIIEKSLSIDNIFVIYLIFISFGVKEMYYKKVLLWGILGAIVMRCIFIFAGAALVNQFHWILYLFGIFLVVTGIVLFLSRKRKYKIEPKDHFAVRFISKYFNIYRGDSQNKFSIRKNGKFFFTPLFIVVLVIEFSDVLFAVDSIPAIFAVSRDPYIIFYSNIFAILGLRALFFLIANLIPRFYYLKIGLSVLLFVIGLKMIVPDLIELLGGRKIEISASLSLYIILGILSISILFSLIHKPKMTGESNLEKE